MGDYAVKVSVRNGRILRRMRELGVPSIAALSKLAGCSAPSIYRIVDLRGAPISPRTNDYTDVALRISSALRCDPDDLFSDAQRTMQLERNSAEMFVDEEVVAMLAVPGDVEGAAWAKVEVSRLLAGLKPRERHVVERRMEGDTLEDIGVELGVNRERVRQIEAKGMRRMKGFATRNNWLTA